MFVGSMPLTHVVFEYEKETAHIRNYYADTKTFLYKCNNARSGTACKATSTGRGKAAYWNVARHFNVNQNIDNSLVETN